MYFAATWYEFSYCWQITMCQVHHSARVYNASLSFTHRGGLLADGVCRPELDVSIDEVISYPAIRFCVSCLLSWAFVGDSDSVCVRVNDSSEHLASAGVVEEDLLLTQGREIASDRLNVHDDKS